MSSDIIFSPEDIAEIVAILEGTGYARLDIRTPRFRLTVARQNADTDLSGWTQEWSFQDETKIDREEKGGAVSDAPAEQTGIAAIRAPLPGTFYRAPQPGAPPFVEVESTVTPQTVVAIVETMKLMTPVHAGTTGTVTEILIENGTQIAGDAILMRVRSQAT